MEEKRIYALARFDEETQRTLAGIYAALAAAGFKGTQTPGIPYHFTLGSVEAGREAQLTEQVRQACAGARPFSVSLSHMGLFGLRVLFLAPAASRELLALHDAVFPTQPAAGAHGWVAHATLLIDEPAVVQRAIPIVSQQFTPMPAAVTGVSVYEFFPARLIAEFSLAL